MVSLRHFFPFFLLASSLASTAAAQNHAQCRPDGMRPTAGVATPYCLVYDANGRESMGADHPRRLIGYFTSWRTGGNGVPSYLAKDIPWTKLTHVNYAFAHIDGTNRISVGNVADPANPATGLQWPGVPGAEMDPQFPYHGHFNLLNKYKKLHPGVKTLVSVGGWAETGGYFDATGTRIGNGGFYTLTVNADGSVNTAAINTFADSTVAFLRTYGFNGIDIDYEYATSMQNAGNPLDWTIANARRANLMRGYVALMKTLREKLDAAAVQDNRYYLLTVAAPASGYLLRGMETYQVTPYLDYVNIMSYDLHGAWNEFVGPNAALYDDGRDAELVRWNVYTTSQYGGLGYLNTDWAYHYFRGAMPAGRINIGVPFYTRGWRDITGGTNGLWGTSLQSSGCSIGLPTCGKGAIGIDNLWHDEEGGAEVPAGSNPLWHAKNLQQGITPDYLAAYGLTPGTDPADVLTGTYQRFYDTTLVAPWLWNAQKKVFLSTEDDVSIGVKAQYVIDRGIGGVMFWELAGDYAWDPTRNAGTGEWFMGNTLTTQLFDRLRTAGPYGNRRNNAALPTGSIDVEISLVEYPSGDSNYPISPKMRIVNHSNQTIPGGAEFQFDYPTSAPANITDWSGVGVHAIHSDHVGNNIGGLDGDFHRASLILPGWQSIAPGATIDVALVYYLPIAGPSNYTLTFGGQSYRLAFENAAGAPTDLIFRNGFQAGSVPNGVDAP